MQKRFEEAWAAGAAAAELYRAALAGFGGTSSPLPADASTLDIFAWFKENIAKLPEFIGGAMDFSVLSCATNLCKTLRRMGCAHFVELRSRRAFEGPSKLGETSGEVLKPVKKFMKYFWLKFGRANARFLAEARHAAVSAIRNFPIFCCFSFLFFAYLLRAYVGFTEGWSPTRRRGTSVEGR